MKCTTHHEACACREERWQRVAMELHYRTMLRFQHLSSETRNNLVADAMRDVGLVRNGEKWELVNESR